MVLNWNQTLIGYSHKLCATIARAYKAGRTGCWSMALWVIGVHAPLSVACRVPSYSQTLEWRLKALHTHQLNFFMFNPLCGCFPEQWGPTVGLQSATLCFSNSLVCLGICIGPSCPTAKLTEPSFSWQQEMASWDTIIPSLVLIRTTFKDYRQFALHPPTQGSSYKWKHIISIFGLPHWEWLFF